MTTKSGGGRPSSYKTKDGKRVPGTTTITGRFKESGGLIHWAWKQGIDGIDYRNSRDRAAGAGTLAHGLIDAHIHERTEEIPLPRELGLTEEEFRLALQAARKAFHAYLDWRAQVNLEIIETETPLVSETHKFGGTFDALAKINGELYLFDWKSSNAIHGDYIAQMGGYDILLEECRGIKVVGVQMLRFGKEYADHHHHAWPRQVLDHGRRAFLLMRELFEVDAILKKAAA
jgi:hypothetical protein